MTEEENFSVVTLLIWWRHENTWLSVVKVK